jgi:hypothetical protein
MLYLCSVFLLDLYFMDYKNSHQCLKDFGEISRNIAMGDEMTYSSNQLIKIRIGLKNNIIKFNI